MSDATAGPSSSGAEGDKMEVDDDAAVAGPSGVGRGLPGGDSVASTSRAASQGARPQPTGSDGTPTIMAKGMQASVSVSLHPLVIMNVAEHWTRVKMQHSKPSPVYGSLIGKLQGRNVDVMNSFELVVDFVDGEAIIDKDYFEKKEEQFKQVFPDLDMLGWYTTGEQPTESDIKVQKQICEINESPVFLQMDPQSRQGSDLPISMYESVIDVIEREATMLLVEVPYTLATEDAERIGVDHVARVSEVGTGGGGGGGRAAGGSSGVSAAALHLQAQHSAVHMLCQRVQLISQYLKDVHEGKLPPNHEILRMANSLSHQLPVLQRNRFSDEFYNQCNDVSLMTYLGVITKGCNTLNQFISKFNVLNEKQGAGRRMRGMLY